MSATALLRKVAPVAGSDASVRSVSIVVEWEHAQLAEAERPIRMLGSPAAQLDKLTRTASCEAEIVLLLNPERGTRSGSTPPSIPDADPDEPFVWTAAPGHTPGKVRRGDRASNKARWIGAAGTDRTPANPLKPRVQRRRPRSEGSLAVI